MTRAGLTNQRGQEIGPKGMKTRARIVEATRTLLGTLPLREISAMEIARASRTSVATFYIYFVDVLSAVQAVVEDVPPIDVSSHFERPWTGVEAMISARGFIGDYLDHYVQNNAVIRVRNHLADEGDTRFADLRSQRSQHVVQALVQQIATGGLGGQASEDVRNRATATAGLLLGMLDRLCALLTRQPYRFKLERDKQVEAGAEIMVATVHSFPQLSAGA